MTTDNTETVGRPASPPSAPPAGSEFRSSAFFMGDVMEMVEYVLDQAAQYHDKGTFISAIIVNLEKWKHWKE
jgi:hypothetical protein